MFDALVWQSLAREKPGNYSDIAQNRDKSHKELFLMSKSPRVSNSVVVPRGLRKQRRRLGLVCKDIVESFYCFAYRCHHTHTPRLGRRITKQKMVPVTKRGGFGLEKYGGQSVLVFFNYMLGY